MWTGPWRARESNPALQLRLLRSWILAELLMTLALRKIRTAHLPQAVVSGASCLVPAWTQVSLLGWAPIAVVGPDTPQVP